MIIPPVALAGIFGKCLVSYPNEACGVVAKRSGTLYSYSLKNVSDDPTVKFTAWDQEQLELWDYLDKRRESPIIAYHSHTRKGSEPIPSGEDINNHDPELLMLIVGLSDPTKPTMRLWQIGINRNVIEIPVTHV